MQYLRWLWVLGCFCLLAVPAQAADTVCTFSGAASDTPYTERNNGGPPGFVNSPGPAGIANYYRLTQAFVNSTNNIIAFDRTATGNSAHAVVDFDYRIGGVDNPGDPFSTGHADGIGFALLNTSVYDITGQGPGITEEGSNAKDSSITVGLDTWDNGVGINDPDNDHISLHYNDANISYGVGVSLKPSGYNLHQDPPNGFDDVGTLFDHFNMTVDIGAGGATVSITITPHGAAAIPVISGFLIPTVTPYEMRAGFGARTGGSTDNHDIANVKIAYSPP